jgi:hypothetical protein
MRMKAMSGGFEMFDVVTANQVGTYETLGEIIRVINDAVGRVGPAAVANLALGRAEEEGDTEVVAPGVGPLRLATSTQQAESSKVFA